MSQQGLVSVMGHNSKRIRGGPINDSSELEVGPKGSETLRQSERLGAKARLQI